MFRKLIKLIFAGTLMVLLSAPVWSDTLFSQTQNASMFSGTPVTADTLLKKSARVPEPATFSLLGIGLLLAARTVRKIQ